MSLQVMRGVIKFYKFRRIFLTYQTIDQIGDFLCCQLIPIFVLLVERRKQKLLQSDYTGDCHWTFCVSQCESPKTLTLNRRFINYIHKLLYYELSKNECTMETQWSMSYHDMVIIETGAIKIQTKPEIMEQAASKDGASC